VGQIWEADLLSILWYIHKYGYELSKDRSPHIWSGLLHCVFDKVPLGSFDPLRHASIFLRETTNVHFQCIMAGL